MQMNDYNDSLNWVRRELGRWKVRESGGKSQETEELLEFRYQGSELGEEEA